MGLPLVMLEKKNNIIQNDLLSLFFAGVFQREKTLVVYFS